MVFDWDRYEKNGYMGQENIKKGTWTSSTTRNMENKN